MVAIQFARRRHPSFLRVAGVLVALVVPVGPLGNQHGVAAQSNTVGLEVWRCPDNVDTSNTDPAYFASACTEPAVGVTFILTRTGRPSTRKTGVDGSVRPWSAVTGPFTLRGEPPNGETAAAFCSENGDPEPVDVEDNTIAGELPPGAGLTCSWFWVPSAPTVTPGPPIPAPDSFVPTVEQSTEPAVSATETSVPTIVEPTATASQAGAFATATAALDIITGGDPEITMPWPHTMQFSMDDRFRVYPEPGSRSEWPVADFVAEVEFVNPSDDVGGVWDYGFLFGPTGSPDDYRLYVDSDRRWFLDLGATTVESGRIERLNLAPGESNVLRLIVTEGTALFYVNDDHVTTLDVPAATDGGKLWLVTSVEGEHVTFLSADVWAL